MDRIRWNMTLLMGVAFGAALVLAEVVLDAIVYGDTSMAAALLPANWHETQLRAVLFTFGILSMVARALFLQARRAEAAARASTERFQTLYQHAPEPIIGLTDDFTIAFANLATARFIDADLDSLVGAKCYEALLGGQEPCEGCLMLEAMHSGQSRQRIKHEVLPRGGQNWLEQTWHPIKNERGDVDLVIETARDLTKLTKVEHEVARRKRAEAKARELAFYDSLTGLPNRYLLSDRLEQTLARCDRTLRPAALMFLDLDNFKHVNDSLGHRVGDVLLTGVAERLRGIVRRSDTVARLGGDEFVLLLPDMDESVAPVLAEKILHALSASFDVDGHELFAGASIGIAMLGPKTSAEAALVMADTAMYEAKAHGRNGYRIYTPKMGIKANQRLQFETEKRRALEHSESA